MSKEEKLEEKRVFYNYRNRPPKVVFCSKMPSKVQEGPLDARSPQELLEKYGMYNDRPALDSVKPFYADLTAFGSFEEQNNHIRDIKEKFMQLDVDIRAKFNHNPEEFCNYLISKDFDIKEIMNSNQYNEYTRILNEKKAEKEYQEYLKSDKYKQEIEEYNARQQYEKERYEEWKKNFKPSK